MEVRTRRRLLYIPDEEALLLGELTDSPRPRPSRLPRLPIPSSEGEDDNMPAEGRSEPPGAEGIDTGLFVSYNSYTLTDGSGFFRPPPTAREAAALYKLLRRSCRFLCGFIEHGSISQSPTDDMSSVSSCSSGCSESLDSESDSELHQRPRKRPKRERDLLVPVEGYNSKTVLELRELLRERNLPISGAKALLVSRLEESDAREEKIGDNDNYGDAESGSTAGAIGSSNGSSFYSLYSENEGKPMTLWGTILNIGSKLLRKSTGSLPEDSTFSRCKRRRSV
ncbi:hypothetical protein DQ04_01001140 [Trypanosoma grayi]|uniref:hypothetical protein n=1 Tax=Trypanosoma grayi TaxID=71804 RepID=UPI0004F46B7F|nr:hypothetical protein DQ04_01001140 [Trypanosoma grayi]KEG13451.1 hypothetical protein DQ04_01001140 [Trypanosoma grayi]